MKQRYLYITTVAFIGVSIVLGVLYLRERKPSDTKQEQYPLLSKRLFAENRSDIQLDLQPLRKEIKTYLANTGLTYSFYFEYLFTGTNIRAGENNKLVGASLMKIPIVMDLYRAVEKGKINLDDVVSVPANTDAAFGSDAQYGNKENLKPGSKISLREAAKVALVESDNTAAYTIFEATKDLLPPEEQAISNLDVETRMGQTDQGNYALIDARSYTSFLTCLYFSCFLSDEHSQAILQHLTSAADESRIPAGVPDHVQVAHKIGSFSDVTQSDCGIVYVPNRRYALCLMLDTDAKTASQHIQKVSELAYKYVTNAP